MRRNPIAATAARLFAGVLLAVVLGPALHAEEPTTSAPAKRSPSIITPEQVADWIKALDDNNYLAREQAAQHLVDAKTVALDPLLAVANSDKPEPADRAIWILRRFGRSRDNDLALAALERLIQLRSRPALVAKAEAELAERSVAVCEDRLGPLGAEIGMRMDIINPISDGPVLTVKLGESWHGKSEDLRQVSKLQQQRFWLEGDAIDDAVVRMFAEKDKLLVLQLVNTKVTPAAVDEVKTKHPDALVYVRNRAILGVTAETHPPGVVVTFVQPSSGAANAGIVPGDIITALDGKKLPDFDRLTAFVAQHQPGDQIDVEIVRKDQDSKEQRSTLKVTLGARPQME